MGILASLTLSIGGLALATADARAQAEPNEADGEQREIVVTGARGTTAIEALQDVAVAVTSIEEENLRTSASNSRADILRRIPGVTVLDLGSFSNIVIRGTSTAPDGDPNGSSTAIYFDDVPLTGVFGSTRNVDLATYDIERIDVLRGPQGTGFGAGASAGIVRNVTRNADPSRFSGAIGSSVKAVSGGRDFGYDIDGHINLPLVAGRLALRLTGYARRDENPIFDARRGRAAGDAQVRGGRLALRYEPTDNFSFDARYLYEHRIAADQTRVQRSLGNFRTNAFAEPSEDKTHLVYGRFNWDLDFAQLTAIASHLSARNESSFNFGPFSTETSSENLIDSRSATRHSNTTLEMRLTDADESGLDWTIGGYYERRTSRGSSAFFFAGTETPATTEFDADGIDDPAFDNLNGDQSAARSRQWAAFGELGYWFSENWNLTLGLRYGHFRSQSAFVETADGITPPALELANDFSPKGAWQPRINLTYKPSTDRLFYLQYARISRPGGNNFGALTDACPVQFQERVEDTYSGDRIETYEGGAKFSGLGRGGAVNISAYYSRWRNAPVYTGVPCFGGPQFYIDNAGVLELYGIEADFALPLGGGFRANGSLALAKSRITAIDPAFSGGVIGDRTPGNPSFKASLTLNYERDLGRDMTLTAEAGASYTGRYKNGLSVDWSTFAPDLVFPGLDVGLIGQFPSGLDRYNDPGAGDYVLANASVSVGNDRWRLRLFADNLLNSKAATLVNYLNSVDGEATFTLVTPRTIGLRGEWKF